jgi:hypothetical protein
MCSVHSSVCEHRSAAAAALRTIERFNVSYSSCPPTETAQSIVSALYCATLRCMLTVSPEEDDVSEHTAANSTQRTPHVQHIIISLDHRQETVLEVAILVIT